MTDCIIFYGNSDFPYSQKTAGPFRIATELRKHGFTVRCIDLQVFKGIDENFKKVFSSMVSNKTLWTGFSGTFLRDIFGKPQLPSLVEKTIHKNNPDFFDTGIKEFVNFAKELNPKMKLLLGGARLHQLESFGFVTFEQYVDKEIVDYTKWLAKLSKNIDLQFYSNKIIGKEYENFSTSQIVYDKTDIIESVDTLPLEIARGCIFKCKFCSYPLNGKKKGDWIKRSETLKDELLRNYEQFGVTNYAFTDDTYNDSLDKLKLLQDEVYSKLPFNIKFASYIRLDLIVRYPEMADILKESGLTSAVCGMETINPRSAKAIGKGLDPQVQIDFARELKENTWNNILMSSNFILGLPHDTKETVDEFENWLFSENNPFDYWYVFALGIFPVGSNKSYYQSEFDLNYAKYGYEMIKDIDHPDHLQAGWRNNRTKLNMMYCAAKASHILKRSQNSRWKFGGWTWPIIQEFVSEKDILTLSQQECREKYNLTELQYQKKLKYTNQLLDLSKLTNKS